uniref:Uncharacterized protein n=1 Tax=Glossina brevipalpis TaxID=37001 RepID=A0A1A9WFY2_9MUSC
MSIVKYYQQHKKFTTAHRTQLVHTIVDFFDIHDFHLSLNTSHNLENQILKMFPTKRLEYYRTEKGGKIYVKFCNMKRYKRYTNVMKSKQKNLNFYPTMTVIQGVHLKQNFKYICALLEILGVVFLIIAAFRYVVNPPPIQKIAFGTTLPRSILPLSGPGVSSFMCAHQGDPLSPGPAAYVIKANYRDYPSQNGFSAFADTQRRLPSLRADKFRANFLGAITKRIKPNPKPFNVGAKRMAYAPFLTPPPSAYACDKPRHKLQISSAFGSEHKYIPYVEIKCSPYNIATCAECGQRPIGDYWHSANDNQDLCRSCMTGKKTIFHSCQIDNAKRRSLWRKLHKYKYRRYCGFFHEHNGTTAAEQIMPTKTLVYKINLENYLSQYITKTKLKRVYSL